MPHSQVAGQVLQAVFSKDIRYQPHIFMYFQSFAITSNNASTFLPPMLQGIEAKIDQLGRIFMAKNAANAAFMFWAEPLRGVYGLCVHGNNPNLHRTRKNERHKEFFPCALCSVATKVEKHYEPD